MCFASSVLPEQLAPLAFSPVHADYLLTYPIPTNTTLRFTLMVYRTMCPMMKL